VLGIEDSGDALPAAASVSIVGGRACGSPNVANPAPGYVSKELLETTKGLQATQQQAVDQLQVVQDQLVAQKEETRKLSEQVATLTEKLQALQQSVANISAPAATAPVSPPKSNH